MGCQRRLLLCQNLPDRSPPCRSLDLRKSFRRGRASHRLRPFLQNQQSVWELLICFYLFCPMGFYHYPLFLFKGDLALLFMRTRFFRSSALFYLIFYVTTFCTLLATIFYYRTAARCIFFMCPDYSTFKRMAAYRLHTYIFF